MYLLLVTAIYIGAMGVTVDVRFESRTRNVEVCRALETSIMRTLRNYGATRIRAAGCPKR